jgi:hypothetical protein
LAQQKRLSMVNPYESPSAPCLLPPKHGRIRGLVLGVVLLNVALNARHVVHNWPVLTVVHYAIGASLWLILPLWAVFLLWRGRRLGRWILVGLFGLRALIGFAELGAIGSFLLHDPWVLIGPYRSVVVDTLFYFGAMAWLISSPGIRSMCSQPRPDAAPMGDAK